MKKLWIPLILGMTFLALPGVVRANTILVSYMYGSNEVPPVQDSPGLGISVVTVSDDMETITYYVAFENLIANATVSHIHAGDPTVAGPISFNFTGIPSDTQGTYGGVLTRDDFTGNGFDTYEDAVAGILNGDTYTNLHSTVHPPGEIRGQLYIYGQ